MVRFDTLSPKQAHIVNTVRKHAELHYNDGGWDYVVEAWSDEDILETAKFPCTGPQAIARVRRDVALMDDRRKDIQAEAGDPPW
jgi:hypothetical protein